MYRKLNKYHSMTQKKTTLQVKIMLIYLLNIVTESDLYNIFDNKTENKQSFILSFSYNNILTHNIFLSLS